jgi:hypothetical protein
MVAPARIGIFMEPRGIVLVSGHAFRSGAREAKAQGPPLSDFSIHCFTARLNRLLKKSFAEAKSSLRR